MPSISCAHNEQQSESMGNMVQRPCPRSYPAGVRTSSVPNGQILEERVWRGGLVILRALLHAKHCVLDRVHQQAIRGEPLLIAILGRMNDRMDVKRPHQRGFELQVEEAVSMEGQMVGFRAS